MDALTFGIELAMICVHDRNVFTNTNWPNLVPDETVGEEGFVGAVTAVRYFLERYGLKNDASAAEPFATWWAHSDGNVLTDTERLFKPLDDIDQSFELASPIFRLDDPTSFLHINKVLEVLRWMERQFKCHFIINESCGFHVHFAYGKEVIPFDVAKRIYQLFLAHERNIDSIHAQSLVLAPTWTRSDYLEKRPLYAPLSAFQDAAHLIHNHVDDSDHVVRERNLFTWLSRVELCDDYGYLCRTFELQMMGDELEGQCAVVNFDNAKESSQSVHAKEQSYKPTIEFRQHLGTLNFEDICRYVKFLGCVITYCAQENDVAFLSTLLAGSSPTYTFEHLCQTMNVPVDIIASFRQTQPPAARMVPSHVLPASLPQLVAQNAYENAVNRDPANVNVKREEKLRGGHYGIKPHACSLVFDERAIEALLASAQKASRPRSYYGSGDTSSAVRSTLFAKLAEIYDATEAGLGEQGNERIIERMIAEWDSK